jgi:hypothetical protein
MTFNGSEADDQSICNGAIRQALQQESAYTGFRWSERCGGSQNPRVTA